MPAVLTSGLLDKPTAQLAIAQPLRSTGSLGDLSGPIRPPSKPSLPLSPRADVGMSTSDRTNLPVQTSFWGLLGNPNQPTSPLLLLSKLIGLSILVLGSVLKLPSVLPVVSSGSTRGIPIVPTLLETFGFTVGIAFNLRHGNSITTWGECICLLVCNLAVLAVFVGRNWTRLAIATALYLASVRFLINPQLCSDATLQWLLGLTVPAFMGGTVLQIVANYRNKHIGAISPATLSMGLACGLGRLLTTFVELDDPVIRGSALLGAGLGFVMWMQMAMYREGTRKFLEHGAKEVKPE
ncbi:hypothetical protein HKX48_006424 [Thoreauomyces humboldtii]|nr:hypothetical protein HKX48_006424 [Thoreauomyces humboldtii]